MQPPSWCSWKKYPQNVYHTATPFKVNAPSPQHNLPRDSKAAHITSCRWLSWIFVCNYYVIVRHVSPTAIESLRIFVTLAYFAYELYKKWSGIKKFLFSHFLMVSEQRTLLYSLSVFVTGISVRENCLTLIIYYYCLKFTCIYFCHFQNNWCLVVSSRFKRWTAGDRQGRPRVRDNLFYL